MRKLEVKMRELGELEENIKELWENRGSGRATCRS